MAPAAHPDSGVYMVPAFTGLGAPYWDRDARAAIVALPRQRPAEIVRGSRIIAYQTRDLFEAMAVDGAAVPTALRVDGGLAERSGDAVPFR